MAERFASRRLTPSVVIMAKAPTCGRVKRRLAGEIGVVAATWFYRGLLRRLVMRLGKSRQWRTYLAASPDRAERRLFEPWRGKIIRQGHGDLGVRMARIFQRLPPGPAIVVGSDIPGVTERRIKAAFAVLRGRDAVFGPAEDGGYWLVGLNGRSLARRMFSGVRWSSEHALTDTLRNLAGWNAVMTATLGDVDDGNSYARHAFLGVRLTIPSAKATHRSP